MHPSKISTLALLVLAGFHSAHAGDEELIVTDIPAWHRAGAWYSCAWSRSWWDGHDVHFQNGFKTHSPVLDVNALGQVFAILP